MQVCLTALTLAEETTSEQALDALLAAAAPFGLVTAAVPSPLPVKPRGFAFDVSFHRASEALAALDGLRNAPLASIKALCQTALCPPAQPPPSRELSLVTSKPIAEPLLTRRFACCGAIARVAHLSDALVTITFTDAAACARAREDVAARGLLPEGVLSIADTDTAAASRPPSPAGAAAAAAAAAAASPPLADHARSGGDASESDSDLKKKKKRQHVSDAAATTPPAAAPPPPAAPPSSAAPQAAAAATTTAAASAPGDHLDTQLFVVHSKSVDATEVTALFAGREGFVAIDVKRNKRSGGVRGMAFVTFATRALAQATCDALNDAEFPADSRQHLKVMFSSSRPPTPAQTVYDYNPYLAPHQQQALAEYELERELAARTSSTTDVLADAFGSVMGFSEPYPYMDPYAVEPYAYYAAHQAPAGYFMPVPDASRLHIAFSQTLQQHELFTAFHQAAPGLQYVSRHKDKPCAFVKYSQASSALLAMVRLNGTFVGGQRLRITLADPMAVDPNLGLRKRQREGRGGAHPPPAVASEEET